MNFTNVLPYIVGILTALGAGIKWMYGALRKERDRYFDLYTEKEREVEELKDQVNKLQIKIIKLEASKKDAFFDGGKNEK